MSCINFYSSLKSLIACSDEDLCRLAQRKPMSYNDIVAHLSGKNFLNVLDFKYSFMFLSTTLLL